MIGQQILIRVEEERGRFLNWAPLFLSFGIGGYFLLRSEPSLGIYASLITAIASLLVIDRLWPWGIGPLARAIALVAFGLCLAGLRSYLVSAPVLDFRYYGPVEGRIIAMDRSQSDAVRLTLDQVRLSNMAPSNIPLKVRISLHGDQGYFAPEIGQTIAATAHLSGPNGPTEPGGFDFRRMAWFRGLGAVGYTRVPVFMLAPVTTITPKIAVTRLRMSISQWVRAELPGETGAFAAAITTGDRSAMSRDTLGALRGANLAHLLAISGLHMGLLTGFVYQVIRTLMSLFPAVALRRPIKKIAAVAALATGAFYLILSGGNVATERAYFMVAMMFVAVLFDRHAISLRAVAMAAVLVLLRRPETLTEPGFQMSFAATTALVATFGWLRDREGRRAPRWAQPILAVVITSAVAGLATAPFGAAHFNQISHFGLLANILSVPLMGAIIMPAAVMAGVLSVVGLGWLGLWVMGPPIDWIIFVAQWVTDLDGAVSKVPAPDAFALPLIALAGMSMVLLRRSPFVSVALLIAAFWGWSQNVRPTVLISQTGGLVGVMTQQGRALSKPQGEAFVARNWLSNDGDMAAQQVAAERAAFQGAKNSRTTIVNGVSFAHVTGRGARDRAEAICQAHDFVILSGWLAGDVPEGCTVFDKKFLAKHGAVALWIEGGEPRVETSKTDMIRRPWTR